MTPEYAAYLLSPSWREKRAARLAISGGRCSVCPTRKGVEVHHLTYERIFQEEMADLLPLCKTHHDKAEKLISERKLGRTGNVLFLGTETVRLLSEKRRVQCSGPVKQPAKWRRRGFGRPRFRWDNTTEQQRHKVAMGRASVFA